MRLKLRKKFSNIFIFLIFSLVIWNFVFEKQGIIDYINLLNRKKELQEEIIELKGREILFLHKKNFLKTDEGLKTVLILRLGHAELLE